MLAPTTVSRARALETDSIGLIELWRDSRRRRFERDVLEGLSARPKVIPAQHLFDERGAKLARAIRETPEHYVSSVERDILLHDARALLGGLDAAKWDVVDLAPGDALGMRLVLSRFRELDVRCVPIASSNAVLADAVDAASRLLPWLPVFPVRAEGFAAIAHLGALDTSRHRCVLLLGSQIGQLERLEALTFLRGLHEALRPSDRLLISFDLLKDPALLERAYDDEAGLHAQLCFNVLGRMNRELHAEFLPDGFHYRAQFCPARHAVICQLVSNRTQSVRVGHFRHEFAQGEPIQTQLACKYQRSEIDELARRAGFTPGPIAVDERASMYLGAWCVTD